MRTASQGTNWALLATLLLAPTVSPAATCTWNVASGAWTVVANWANCADGGGPSTRVPNGTDIAVITNGQATLSTTVAVGELELASGGIVAASGGGLRTIAVTTALRFNGGTARSTLGTNQLAITLPAGGNGQLVAASTLDGAVFIENAGTLNLGSASGAALTLSGASELRNLAGGVIHLDGGNARLELAGSSLIDNRLGAQLLLTAPAYVGQPTGVSASSRIINNGTMSVSGSGTVSFSLGSTTSQFQQYGTLDIHQATLVCNRTLSPGACSYADGVIGQISSAVTRLDQATLDLGGANYRLSEGAVLAGEGTVNAAVLISGTLAPGAITGTPYGTITLSKASDMQATGVLSLDLGGTSNTLHDRVVVNDLFGAGTSTTYTGVGAAVLRLAAGYSPALNEQIEVLAYTGFDAGAAFQRIDANHALPFAARFDATSAVVFPAPRLSLSSESIVEGDSGTRDLHLVMQLSPASSLTVSADIFPRAGTATDGPPPAGDYLYPGGATITFAPGETSKTLTFVVSGDTVVEGPESFAVDVYKNKLRNAAFGNGYSGNLVATGTILSDDVPANTRYVLVGKDENGGSQRIRRYTTDGTFVDTWAPSLTVSQGYIASGLCAAPDGAVLSTHFRYANAVLHDRYGAVIESKFGSFSQMDESCVFDNAGHVYIGQAGAAGATDAEVAVLKFSRDGRVLDSYVVPTGARGTDWIELAGDQCTLYYTSEDTSVRRYNLCTRTYLGEFVTGLTAPFCYALKLRPNHELMVACQDAVHRISAAGVVLQTYTRESIGETEAHGLFALNLDPDGTSFWTAGLLSGKVYRVDIASGTVLANFTTGTGGVAGLFIYDELRDSGDLMFADGFEGAAFVAPKRRMHRDCELAPHIDDEPPSHYAPRWLFERAEAEEDEERDCD